ncbi:metalloregulator ArsR/SmtB family transcription factor [Undibacterium sp. TS12]|uniref:ArsR/SmtB family transcription factor n=1 Tax=Undibacterium sp. TS12 TaxID=2908202 RepID=UPI001F4CAE89|nr:metalloregulator ArsR/SmtB family transcription factor [Undibacterium sp. TS12]MCH8619276.1 metalloregulator ArsR/SmtB family transcription factor [Undibacterium sp. TS12]
MLEQTQQLDQLFSALGDSTRRAVLARLCRGPAQVSELAQDFDMALPSFTQHLRVLENSGLVYSEKKGRVRTYQLAPQALKEAEQWLARQRSHWEARFNQLDTYLNTLKETRND